MKKKVLKRTAAVILSALLVINCFTGAALADEITEPVVVPYGEHVTIRDDINVKNESVAVCVAAGYPEESLEVIGNVSLTNDSGYSSAVYVEAGAGNATAIITGSVSAKAQDYINALEIRGNRPLSGGTATIKVSDNVSAESKTLAYGVDSNYGVVDVGGNVTAKAGENDGQACGIYSGSDESIKVGGNINVEGLSANGVYAVTEEETTLAVTGSVSATGKAAYGLNLQTFEFRDNDTGETIINPVTGRNKGGNLSVTVGKGITAVSTGTNPDTHPSSQGILFGNFGETLSVDVTGDVTVESPIGRAVGISTLRDEEQIFLLFVPGKSEILVHGNVFSDGIGIALDNYGEDTDINILVEKEIQAETAGVLIRKSRYAEENITTMPKLTVWKIQVNDKGNVVEAQATTRDLPDVGGAPEADYTLASDFEKQIMYIVNVEKPDEGGTIKAVDKDGKSLSQSYDFDVAHEGDKVILAADLDEGYEIAAAYNGVDEKKELSKDEDGNYYIIVPKGGGVNLSVELKKIEYTVKFTDEDGTELQSSSVPYGDKPSYAGETPTKAADNQYTYTFAGWYPEITAVTKDATYKATYESKTKEYAVKFVNEDGTELQSSSVPYGEKPSFAGDPPTKAADEQYTYTFAGWSPEITAVTKDATYKATYTKETKKYTIKFTDEDGTVLQSSDVAYGEKPEYKGDTPTKAATAEFTYTFAGWTTEIATVTGEATYKAKYTESKNSYTIIWQQDDGTEIDRTTVEYGQTPTHAEPTKAATAQYTYTFAGWTPEITAVTGDATYKAAYTSETNKYTVTFKNADGTVLQTVTVAYGETPEYTGEAPAKPEDDENIYTFAGWDQEISAVTGETVFIAVFTATPKAPVPAPATDPVPSPAPEPAQSPTTADNGPVLWIVLLFAGLSGFGAVVVYSRKRARAK